MRRPRGLKGRKNPAQGNALGIGHKQSIVALKGHNKGRSISDAMLIEPDPLLVADRILFRPFRANGHFWVS